MIFFTIILCILPIESRKKLSQMTDLESTLGPDILHSSFFVSAEYNEFVNTSAHVSTARQTRPMIIVPVPH